MNPWMNVKSFQGLVLTMEDCLFCITLGTLSTFDSNYENALSLIHVCKSYYGLFYPSSLDMRMDIKHAHIWVVYHFYSQSSQGYNLIAIDKRFGNQSSIIEPFDLYILLMKIK